MTGTADETLRRWLDAERRSARHDGPGEAAAERALRELLLALPALAPRPGFAKRVLAAAPHLRPARRTVPVFGWPARALVGVCLLLTGGALMSLPRFAAVAAESITLADAVSAVASTVTLVVDVWVALAAAGEFFGLLYEAFVRVAMSPTGTLVWLGALVFSLVNLHWLHRLLAPPSRSSGYVPAH